MRLKEIIAAGSLLVITSMASAQECYDSSILTPNPFMGNAGEIFKLADGFYLGSQERGPEPVRILSNKSDYLPIAGKVGGRWKNAQRKKIGRR